MFQPIKYRRVLLKLSGQILAGDKGFGVDADMINKIADQIIEVRDLGLQLGIVIGGGNIFRGVQVGAQGLDRTTGDYMGMLATAMNALALQDILEKKGSSTRVMSAIEMRQVCEPYIRRRAQRHLEKGRILIFACGTGNPFFTTDTTASLRAMEIGADILLKGTRVDAVYDSDPEKNPDAKPYAKLTFMDVLKKQLKILDASAISLCMDNNLPTLIFNVGKPGNLKKVIVGEDIGTLIYSDK